MLAKSRTLLSVLSLKFSSKTNNKLKILMINFGFCAVLRKESKEENE